ncbi:MAG: maleylpyruvate isomerase family mycothiol-dependent enzyme [Microbacteriaceae bacterium]|nr:maleylpyruvate isomerase family mycothiol-dependent enzyme [Microbacteriaceae bacterium]
MTDPIDQPDPAAPDDRPAPAPAYSRPPNRLGGDWSAHIATALDRLAQLLEGLDEAQWEAPSRCEGWRVRDVVGHLVHRLGASTGELVRAGLVGGVLAGFSADRALDRIARAEAEAPTAELVAALRTIGAGKLRGEGRTGVVELTEAVVHAYDIAEALGAELRLSPRSTGAVALARLRTGGRATRIARERSLRATDAHWVIGHGPALDATAGEILMHLFGRGSLDG